MAGNFPMNVYNNMIVNNVSTHEGGGIALDDAPNVRIFNNTIMKNLTTATAVTSNGQPAPAGLSTAANSDQLQATLPGAARRPSATRCCSTTSSGTTGPAPGPAPRSPASASPATPARSTTGTSASPTAPGSARADQLDRPADAAPPVHGQPDQQLGGSRRSSRPTTSPSRSPPGGRTRRSWTPRS